MPNATVSVIVPVYNRSKSVIEAIQSVLAQSFADLELIVVDDASSDDLAGSLAAIKDRRLRVLTHAENKGVSAARNTGIREARGKYIAFLDSDDRWLPQKLQYQLDFIQATDESVTANCTGYRVFNRYHPEGEVRISVPVLARGDLMLGCRVSPGSTLLAQRTVFETVGLFDESLRRLEDWDWLLRFTEHSTLSICLAVLTEVDNRSGVPNLEDVVESVRILREKYVSSRMLRGSDRRKFEGTLDNEIAAAAYKNGRILTALYCFMISFFNNPFRNFDSIKRIFRTVTLDLHNWGK